MTDTIHVPARRANRPRPLIAFVGEAPSDEELVQGKPLVGPSGRIFNAILRTARLERAEFWVGNVFDEQLPDNSVRSWCVPRAEAAKGGFDDLPPIGKNGVLRPEHRWHLERLRRELEEAQPQIIVPLGGTALWAFTGADNITQMRGTVLLAEYVRPRAKLLPTFHPAHVMRMWKFFPVVVQDIQKAVVAAQQGPGLQFPQRKLLLEPHLGDLYTWKPRLLASKLLSVDIETGWGQITCIGFAPDAENAICVPFVDFRKPDRNYWATLADELRAWEWVEEVLESPTPKLGQNYGAYDAFWLYDQHGIETRNLQDDTRLLHHALFPELPKSLEFMGASYTEQGAWKRWGRGEKRDD